MKSFIKTALYINILFIYSFPIYGRISRLQNVAKKAAESAKVRYGSFKQSTSDLLRKGKDSITTKSNQFQQNIQQSFKQKKLSLQDKQRTAKENWKWFKRSAKKGAIGAGVVGATGAGGYAIKKIYFPTDYSERYEKDKTITFNDNPGIKQRIKDLSYQKDVKLASGFIKKHMSSIKQQAYITEEKNPTIMDLKIVPAGLLNLALEQDDVGTFFDDVLSDFAEDKCTRLFWFFGAWKCDANAKKYVDHVKAASIILKTDPNDAQKIIEKQKKIFGENIDIYRTIQKFKDRHPKVEFSEVSEKSQQSAPERQEAPQPPKNESQLEQHEQEQPQEKSGQ